MIVTEARIIKAETFSSSEKGPLRGYTFHRSGEKPGLVTVTDRAGNLFELPANEHDVEEFIRTYRRVASADVGYKTSEVE